MLRYFIFTALLFSLQVSAQTGIGTTSPHASAKFEVFSENKGFLPPRMTASQRGNIPSPAAGLMVYQTDGTSGLYYYNGSAWIYIINSTTNVVSVVNGGTGTTTSTGTGSVVLNTSPSFTTPSLGAASATSIVVPTITGGTGTTQNLTFKPTSGNGTTGADHIFQVGNNGGTEAMRILNNGNIGIGIVSPTEKLEVNGSVKASSFIGSASSALSAPTNITYGQINVPQNLNVASGGDGFTNLVDIPLPSAGTYKITYIARVSVANSATLAVLFLRNGSNTQVSGSEATPIFNLAGVQVMSTMTTYVTTSGAETYKFGAWVNSGAGNLQIINDGNGRSKVLWEKIQ